MRLIDADKLMESLDPKESVWVGLVLSELIANAPTVEAITVEWIENKLKCCDNINAEIFVKSLIRNWRKENGRS